MLDSVTFGIVTMNGLIDAFNPCAIGVFLATITVFVALKNMKDYRKNIFFFGLFYILAIYVTYLLIGIGILKATHFFGIHSFFGWFSAILLIVMGLLQFTKLPCLIPKKIPEEATILGAVIFGVLVGICEFPCSGGIYLATVGFIGIKSTFWNGLRLLIWYNLMFVLPLIIIFALSYNLIVAKKISKFIARYGKKVHHISAIIMIGMGLLFLLRLLLR